MRRNSRRWVLVLLSLTSVAVFVGQANSEGRQAKPKKQSEKVDGKSVDLTGIKMIVAFDPYSGNRRESKQRQQAFRDGIKASKAKVLKEYHYGFYQLVDCSDRTPADVLKKIPQVMKTE